LKNWHKKDISRETVKLLHDKYGVDSLTASILARRGITNSKDILYYVETDLRYLHNPFLFSAMEDAVDRINNAREEGEKILIFGDSDVDGISSTAILFEFLKNQGLDVQWRLPVGDDAYGLSIQAVDDFAKEYGSLIITVDCGISNSIEIAHAVELGIDVIVTDHHNPPENLPSPAIIIDPKMKDSDYPFSDISGAAVAFKLVSALRFSRSELYKQEVCLLDIEQDGDSYHIDCRKLRNLLQKETLSLTCSSGAGSIMNTKLPSFLAGQQLFVWNEIEVKQKLATVFGTGVEFNMMDLQPPITRIIPPLADKPLPEVKELSRVMKYLERPAAEIDGLHSLFITFARSKLQEIYPQDTADEQKDLQLVMLAALADIMPMKDENRILVRTGLSSINNGRIRPGLAELFARLSISGKQISSTDLSWSVIPSLNAAGRMGQSNISLQLLLSSDPAERDKLAQQIIDMNEQRKTLVQNAVACTGTQAEESISLYGGKLCTVVDERINKGITGILAARFVSLYNIPAIAVTLEGDTAIGSMRSCRSFNATDFLNKFGDFFINHGGHNYAAGFSFKRNKLDDFIATLKSLVQNITLAPESDEVTVDAELPTNYLTPQLLQVVDRFEPFGEGNPEILFLCRSLPVHDASIVGKTDPRHLKLIMDCGKYKFPAMYWRGAVCLNRDFKIGDKIDVLFNIGRNSFNGAVTPQMTISDIRIPEK
jgi:single-stranded-DNA-specific exonuclease